MNKSVKANCFSHRSAASRRRVRGDAAFRDKFLILLIWLILLIYRFTYVNWLIIRKFNFEHFNRRLSVIACSLSPPREQQARKRKQRINFGTQPEKIPLFW